MTHQVRTWTFAWAIERGGMGDLSHHTAGQERVSGAHTTGHLSTRSTPRELV